MLLNKRSKFYLKLLEICRKKIPVIGPFLKITATWSYFEADLTGIINEIMTKIEINYGYVNFFFYKNGGIIKQFAANF